MKRYATTLLPAIAAVLCLCSFTGQPLPDWLVLVGRYDALRGPVAPEDITIRKELLYDKYTLEDEYEYNKATRRFQWDSIRIKLAFFETLVSEEEVRWGILQNYGNRNGDGAAPKNYKTDAYKRVIDQFGTEKYQATPLYEPADTITPYRYARDGALAKVVAKAPGSKFVRVSVADMEGEYLVPEKYIKAIDPGKRFRIAIVVDKTNQNIATLERTGRAEWLVRSMNPATTGVHQPPYKQETPTGMFVLQDRKPKMYYTEDGGSAIEGFAPWANRFTRGAYVHGVPVNNPHGAIVEYSWSLGTTPRSHMCVRNATSHSKFVYDWAPLEETLVFVIE